MKFTSPPALAGLLALSLLAGFVVLRDEPSTSLPSETPVAEGMEADSSTIAGVPPLRPAVGSAPKGMPIAPESLPASFTPPAPDLSVLDCFDDWVHRWRESDAIGRERLREEGEALAATRRQALVCLIVNAPELAVARSVPRTARATLPDSIVTQLEQPISARGVYELKFTCDCAQNFLAGGPSVHAEADTERSFKVDGVTFRAHVPPELRGLAARSNAPLSGIQIDGELAVSANAVRRLEPGESPPVGAVVRPLPSDDGSPGATSDSTDAATVEIAGQYYSVHSDAQVAALSEDYNRWVLNEYSGSDSSGFFQENFPNPSTRKIGNYKLLLIRVNYSDKPYSEHTEESTAAVMREVERIYSDWSYGKLVCTTTIVPRITVPASLTSERGMLSAYAQDEARALGYDSSQYDTVVLIIDDIRGSAFWNTASFSGGLNSALHEIGHKLGAWHASFWPAQDGTGYGYTGGNIDLYGNIFDIMGNYAVNGERAHFSCMNKIMLGWLAPKDIFRVESGGTFRIHAFDQPLIEQGKRYALVAKKDRSYNYYFEYRPSIGGQVANSALVMLGDEKSEARLVDTTPQNNGQTAGHWDQIKYDSGVAVGRTFSDLEADMHFTVIAKNNTSPPSLDIVYKQGPFPGNQAPVLDALAASTTSIGVGESITFNASAAVDADGDALAYHWDFSDGGTAPSRAEVSRSFDVAAQVTAMVTVSDMKGGTTRRHVVVNVGNHGKQTVTGKITLGDQPLEGVYVTAGGGAYAFTDRSGNYVLSNLGTGSTTVTATFNGYELTPSFTNPLTVVAGANVANWRAAPTATFVSIARLADATEGGESGSFRITRTGSTAQSLDVRVAEPGAAAIYGTDYTLSPDRGVDPSQKYWVFTIPAGQSSLDVTVAAVDDTQAEGPERLRLHLSLNGNYLLNSAGAMELTIQDNDSALPQVEVIAGDRDAAEAPADSASFVFSRAVSSATPLDLTVAWVGSATNGVDYIQLPSVVTIPAGQRSTTVVVSPINDGALERAETVIPTIQASGTYLIASGRSSAQVEIADDEVPSVSVSVPDGTASESGPDTGTFLIQRTGGLAEPLKVYYGVSGTALHGRDYASLSGEVVIPAGARSAPVLILPAQDSDSEGTETVVLSLAAVTDSYHTGSVHQGTIRIFDRQQVPVVNVRSGSVGVEGSSDASVTFRASGSGPGSVMVNYLVSGSATSGVDFTALPGSILIPTNGINDVTLTIPVINDVLAEATERVTITLLPSADYQIEHDDSADALIRDDDSGADCVFATVNKDVIPSESGPTAARFTFTRNLTATDLTVNYELSGTATQGVDYEALPGSVVIPAGSNSVNVSVVPIDDAVGEGVETVTLRVIEGAGYSPENLGFDTMEIRDNDDLPFTVGFATPQSLISELPGNNGEYRDIEVRLSAASASPVSVEVVGGVGSTATGDQVDWTLVDPANGNLAIPKAVLSFPPGVTSRTVRIAVKNDGINEPVESLSLVLRSPVGTSIAPGNGTHLILIFDGAVPAVGSLVTEERWNGTAVYNKNTWNSVVPSYTGFLPGFTPVRNVAENFSRRLTGLLTPPATGTYTFWIASDDASRLFIGTSAAAASKVQRASVSGHVSYQNWTESASQVSVPIDLVAGQSYYLEVQHLESGGDDHLSVAWEGPGFNRRELVLASSDNGLPVVRFAVDSSIRTEADGAEPGLVVYLDRPAGATGATVDLSLDGTATSGSDYLLNGSRVTFSPGESTKNIPFSMVADGVVEKPEWLRLSLVNPVGASIGSSPSHTITLLDSSAPVVEVMVVHGRSSMVPGTDLGGLVATTAPSLTVAGWSILAGNTGSAFSITSAGRLILANPTALPNPGGMQLIVRATDSNGAFGDGVVDVIANGPANAVLEQRWASALPFDLLNWRSTPNYSEFLPTFSTAQNVGDYYSRRLVAYLKPTLSGDYTFWIAGDDQCRLLLSSDHLPENARQIAAVGSWTGYQQWDADRGSSFPRQMSVVVPLVAGKCYWMEVHHQELSGGDHVSVAWQRAGGLREVIPANQFAPVLPEVDFSVPIVPPMIALTSPTAGVRVTTGPSLALTAEVMGGNVAVSEVAFYRGSALIGSDSTAPYSVLWSMPPEGDHTLTAKVSFAGGSVMSQAVPITVVGDDPLADPDQDGFNTALELTLGTNPRDAESTPGPLYAGLIGWWKLDETSGNRALDSTGRPQIGTVVGATWGRGFLQGGLSFDGVDDQVTTSVSLLNSRAAFTLSGWFRTSGGNVSNRGLFGQNGVVEIGIDDNQIKAWTGGGGGMLACPMPAMGQWHHLACAGDGTSVRLYVDGVLAATKAGVTSDYGSSNDPFRMGGGVWDSTGGNFNGLLDDVRVYQRALSAAEILQVSEFPTFVSGGLVQGATEGTAFRSSLQATMPVSSNSLAFSKVGGPGWLSVAADGRLVGTPQASDVGVNSFEVRVRSSGGASASATLLVNVNGLPRFLNPSTTVPVAYAGVAYQASIEGLASDPEGGSKTFTKLSGPAWITVSPGGLLQGVPGLGDVGNHLIPVRVSDPLGASTIGVISLTVQLGSNYGSLKGRDVSNEYIKRIRFADLDHTSGADGGYGDYASLQANVQRGQSVNFTFTPGWSGNLFAETWSVWVDLNRDGDFDDAGEMIVSLGSKASEQSGSVLIPASASVGLTRMRIAMRYSTIQRTPTGTFVFGEVQDYSLMIGTPPPTNAAPYFLSDPLQFSATVAGLSPGATLAGTAGDWENQSLTFAKDSGPVWLVVSANGALSGVPPRGVTGLQSFVVRVTDAPGSSDTTVLNVDVTSSGFASWQLEKGLQSGDLAPDADTDRDGIPNAIEFVIGGKPSGAGSDSSALLPVLTSDTTHLVYSFRRTDASVYLNPGVEYSSGLTEWTSAVHGLNGVTVTTNDDYFGPGIDRVNVRVPRSAVNRSELFLRLHVSVP